MFRVILFTLLSSAALVAAAPQPFRRPLVFEPNRGQAQEQLKWLARGPGYQLFITSEGLRIMMQEGAAEPSASEANGSKLREPKLSKLKYSVVEMKLTGSQPWKKITGLEPTGGVSNYIRGRDGTDSLNGIANYARVSVAGMYDGIDLVFYSHEGDLEYDFVVKPGADPKKIQLAFEGTEGMRVDDQSGDLILTAGGGSELRQIRPTAYQEIDNKRFEVAGGYKLLDRNRAAFTVPSYDPRHPLVIDPTVSFTRFLSGSTWDLAMAVAVDSNGNSYVTGATHSTDFPLSRAFDSSYQDCAHSFGGFCSGGDGFVTKLAPNGTILFSTYFGAGEGLGIAVDSTGVFVTGAVWPGSSPDTFTLGGSDVWLLKLTLDGDPINYNAFGGNGDDIGFSIAVDSQHNAWVGGATESTNFAGSGSGMDAIVLKFTPDFQVALKVRLASSGSDRVYGIAVDPADQPWITGATCGNGFPTTDGITHFVSGCAVFVGQLHTDGSTRMSAVFGGSSGGDAREGLGGDAGTAIVPNGSNTAYVTGYTNSDNFPTTPGAYQIIRSSSDVQAFVSEFDSSSLVGHIVRSTLLGADGNTSGLAIASLAPGGVYVAGSTSSSHFPGAPALTPNPTAGFVSKFSQDLTHLSYTKLLGADVDGLAVLKPATASGVPEIYAAGDRYTGGTDSNNLDAFVVKLDDDVAQAQALWQDPSTGSLITGLLDAQGNVTSTQKLAVQCGPSDGCSQSWKVIGTLDVNRDGVGDILLYDAIGGDLQAWLLNSSGAFIGIQTISRLCGTADGCSQTWEPVGAGDFNHDGIDDLLWHNNVTGELQAWLLDGAGGAPGTLTLSKKCAINDGCWATWEIIGIGDFDDDGIDDLFWLNIPTGSVTISLMDASGAVRTTQTLANRCGPSDGCSATWKPVGIADVNHDGRGDLLWENPKTGELLAWLLNGTDRILGTQSLSLKCNAAAGCPAEALPVGILRNFQATP